MKTSEKGKQIIKIFEGLRLTPYKCPAGIWTIGYGHTAQMGAFRREYAITKEEALDLLEKDLKKIEEELARNIDLSTVNQNQFDAFVSFIFNLGINNFNASTIKKKHKEGHFKEAGDAFLMWIKARNSKGVLVPLEGLKKRRKMERDLYLGEV